MAEQSTMEKLQDKFRVKVAKKEPDVRSSIAGEPFINPGDPLHDGTKNEAGELTAYAIIPVHSVDQVKAHNKQYVYGEPFMPEAKSEDEKKDSTLNCDFSGKSALHR